MKNLKRFACLVICAVMLLGLLPGMVQFADAAKTGSVAETVSTETVPEEAKQEANAASQSASISDVASAFISGVRLLQDSVGTVYAGKPYGLNREIEALWDDYKYLTEGDKLNLDVAAAREDLDYIQTGVTLETSIVRFINAALSLIERIDGGLDIGSEDCQELAAMVLERYGALTEKQMMNPEVVDAWERLCGLLAGDSGTFAANGDYEIRLGWIAGTGCTLSNNDMRADWVVSKDNIFEWSGCDIKLGITVNQDLPEGTVLLTWDKTLYQWEFPRSYGTHGTYTSGTMPMIRYVTDVNEINRVVSPDGFMCRENTSTGKCEIVTSRKVSQGMDYSFMLYKCVVPYLDTLDVTRHNDDVPFEIDGVMSYRFTDGFGYEHVLEVTRQEAAPSLSINTYTNRGYVFTKDQNPWVQTWSPLLEKAYGVTEEQFNTETANGNVFVEFQYELDGYTTAVSNFDLIFTPSGGGTFVSGAILCDYRHRNSVYDGQIDHFLEYAIPLECLNCYKNDNGFSRVPFDNYYLDHEELNSLYSLWDDYQNKKACSIAFFAGDTNWGMSIFKNSVVAGRSYDQPWVSGLCVFSKSEINLMANVVECRLDVVLREALSGSMISKNATVRHDLTFAPSLIPNDYHYSSSLTSNIYLDRGSSLLGGLWNGGTPEYMVYGYSVESYYRFVQGEENTIGLEFNGLQLEDQVLNGSDKYELFDFSISAIVGTGYFSDSGQHIGSVSDLDSYGDDILKILVCTNGSPNTWILDQTVTVRDVLNLKQIIFKHDGVFRVRVLYENRKAFVAFRYHVNWKIKSAGIKLYENEIKSGKLNQLRVLVNGSMTCFDSDHVWAISKDVTKMSAFDSLFSELYALDGYNETDIRPFYHEHGYVMSRGAYFETDGYSVVSLSDRNVPVQNDIYVLSHSTTFCLVGITCDDPVFDLDTAVYKILLPDTVEVVGVTPGTTGLIKQKIDSMSSVNAAGLGCASGSLGLGNNHVKRICECLPELEYTVGSSHDGYFVLTVSSKLSYDRAADYRAVGGAGDYWNFMFGNFTVSTRPKYSEGFVNKFDTRTVIGSYVLNADGTPWNGSYVERLKVDSGISTDIGSGTKTYLADLDGNGSTKDVIAVYEVSDGAFTLTNYSSGVVLRTKGSETGLYGEITVTKPGNLYQYRIAYSQMSESSQNVVLFDSLEDPSSNALHGTLASLDMSDLKRQGLGCKIYGNTKRVDSDAYVTAGINGTNLGAGYDGWKLLTTWSSTQDPIISGDILNGIQSIAFDFGSQVFSKEVTGQPSSVLVYMNMTAPLDGLGYGQNIIENRAFFSDILLSNSKARTVMSNSVTVDVDTSVEQTLTKYVGKDISSLSSIDRLLVTRDDAQYVYRLEYNIGSGTVSDLILFDRINRFVPDDASAGVLTKIDLSDVSARGMGCKVYGNTKHVDTALVDSEYLASGQDGWVLLGSPIATHGYSITGSKLDGIRFIAIDFEDRTFSTELENRPDGVTVDLYMKPEFENLLSGMGGELEATRIRYVINDANASMTRMASGTSGSLSSNNAGIEIDVGVHSISTMWVKQEPGDWSSGVMLDTEKPYSYQVRYQVGKGLIDQVILGMFPEYELTGDMAVGHVTGIDFSGLADKNLGCTVYGNTTHVDPNDYPDGMLTRDILDTASSGWTRLGTYAPGTGFDGSLDGKTVYALAFDLGDASFKAGDMVSVAADMSADIAGLSAGENTFAFRSTVFAHYPESGRSGIVTSIPGSITLDIGVADSLVKLVGPDAEHLGESCELSEYEGDYLYRLQYQVMKGSVSDLVLWDLIENESISGFAGTVIGLDLAGCGGLVPEIYVQGCGKDDGLPDKIASLPGDWKLASVDEVGGSVTGVALYFKDATIRPSTGVIYADILMKSNAGSRNPYVKPSNYKGLSITFHPDCKTDLTGQDYVEIYYMLNGTMYKAGKYKNDFGGTVVNVPSKDFYLYWHTDFVGDNRWGFEISGIKETNDGFAGGSAASLPGYTPVETNMMSDLTSVFDGHTHGKYGNNVNRLWHFTYGEPVDPAMSKRTLMNRLYAKYDITGTEGSQDKMSENDTVVNVTYEVPDPLALPDTGGVGTASIMAAGAALLLFGLAALILKRRKE